MTQEEFIAALNLHNVSEQDQQAIMRNALVVVEHRFADVLEDAMTNEQAEALNQLVEKADAEAISEWIKTHIPDAAKTYDAVLREYADELREELAD